VLELLAKRWARVVTTEEVISEVRNR
jgi:hypothetical protein